MRRIATGIVLIIFVVSLMGCASAQKHSIPARLPRDLVEWWVNVSDGFGPKDELTKQLESYSLCGPPRTAAYAFNDNPYCVLIIPRPRLSPLLFMDVEIVPDLLNEIDKRIPRLAEWADKATRLLEEKKKKGEEITLSFELFDSLEEHNFYYQFNGTLAVLGCILGCEFDEIWRVGREPESETSREESANIEEILEQLKEMESRQRIRITVPIKRARTMIKVIQEFEQKLLVLLGPEPEDPEKRHMISQLLDEVRDIELGARPERGRLQRYYGDSPDKKAYDKLLKEIGTDALPMLMSRILKRDSPKVYLILLSNILGIITQYEMFAGYYCAWSPHHGDEWEKRMAGILLEREISRLERLIILLRKHWKKAKKTHRVTK